MIIITLYYIHRFRRDIKSELLDITCLFLKKTLHYGT